MLSVLFGALSAVGFGAADFLGGLAAKRLIAMLVTGLAGLAGVVALVLAAPLDKGVWYADTTLLGIGTGITSCLGIWLLYSAYAHGPMTTLAPIVAIVSTVVPTTAGLLSGETFSPLGWGALAVGILAIGLVSIPRQGDRTPTRRVDAGKAALAGVFLGVLYIYLDSTPLDSGLTPLTANRISCTVLALSIAGIIALRTRSIRAAAQPERLASTRPEPEPAAHLQTAVRPVLSTRRRQLTLGIALALACTSGLLDASANTLFLIGLSAGDLSVLSVISGFYPAVTILLALLILRERPSVVQTIGIGLALVSMLGMSLA